MSEVRIVNRGVDTLVINAYYTDQGRPIRRVIDSALATLIAVASIASGKASGRPPLWPTSRPHTPNSRQACAQLYTVWQLTSSSRATSGTFSPRARNSNPVARMRKSR